MKALVAALERKVAREYRRLKDALARRFRRLLGKGADRPGPKEG